MSKVFHVGKAIIRKGFLYDPCETITNKMIKSTIAAVAATPLLVSGAAFAGPYVNLEATGSYPD